MNVSGFETKKFSKGLRGYDPHEVDLFQKEVLTFCKQLEDENIALKEKITRYEKQEHFIQAAIIRAEQTAENTRTDAEQTAQSIRAQAEQTASHMIHQTEAETKAYRDQVYKCFYSYERDLRLIVDHFYTLARKHMEDLEKELAAEIQSTISRFDGAYHTVPKLIFPDQLMTQSKETMLSISDEFKMKEEALLLGRKLHQDISDPEGTVLAKKGTVVTPTLITNLIEKGLYGDLILSVDSEEE